MTLLEGGLKRDFLLANFETTNELLGSCNLIGHPDDNAYGLDAVMALPWIPLATSAVALRLMELDASICYTPDQKKDFQKDGRSGYFIVSTIFSYYQMEIIYFQFRYVCCLSAL